MLRRRTRFELFAAVFFEAVWCGHGWVERDARVFAARGGRGADGREEAACCFVSARGSGWAEYCCAVWRARLLPHAADDCDSPAEERIARCGGGPRWIFWIAPEPCSAGAARSQKPIGDRSRGGFARPDTFAF